MGLTKNAEDILDNMIYEHVHTSMTEQAGQAECSN